MSVLVVALARASEIPTPELDAQLYHPPVDATSTAWAEDSHLAAGPSARVAVGYLKQPVVWIWGDGERVAVVDDVLTVNAIAAYSLWRLRAAVDVSAYPFATGERGSGAGFGDIALDVKGVVLDRETAAVGLAIDGRLALPTSTSALPLGAPGFRGELATIVDTHIGPVVGVANLGARVGAGNGALASAFVYRVGAGIELGDAGISLDLAGQLGLPDDATARTLEALVGGWYRPAPAWAVRAALGRGLVGGVGSPTARLVVTLGWEPPKRAAKVARPAAVVTRGGEILVVPGTSPLPPGMVHIKVIDAAGRPLDAKWAFGSAAKGPVVGGLGVASVSPGPWSILVSAEGYGVRALSIDVESGLTSSLEAILQAPRARLRPGRIELTEKLLWRGSTLDPESRAIVEELSTLLRAHPEITQVRIEGHTDSDGNADENLALSGARATMVRAALVESGLDPERFVVAGYGGARPLDSSGTPEARAANERIELVILAR